MGHHEANGKSDEWYTPKYVFDALGVRFELDVACAYDISKVHVPCDYYLNRDSLSADWHGFVWMNPPFGGRNAIEPWLAKLHKHGNGIALTPDRTSCPWWQKYARLADCHLQVAGKIKFIDANGDIGTKPGNGTTLFAFGEQAVQALLNAQKKGLGIVFQRISAYQLSAV